METQSQSTLWCLPYDTDSVFRVFLKIPFSTYLNNLISNEHFPSYQAAVARELQDRSCWNQKSWLLIQYFQFLNDSFDINFWDSRIFFIEVSHLRSIMGFFRLWIDTERLYLVNFLKLDSNQFQDDRIFMTLYRTLLFLGILFDENMTSDIDPRFLREFVASSIVQMQALAEVSNPDTSEIIEAIITLFRNLQRKEHILIEANTRQSLKKSATIKVSKKSETIREVENRLQNSAFFKLSLDEEQRLNRIAKTDFLGNSAQPDRRLYDPIFKIENEFVTEAQFYGSSEEQEARREQGNREKVDSYKRSVNRSEAREESLYATIDKGNKNPYSLKNYQIYGEMVKVDMDDRQKYEKRKVAVVASQDENDRSRIFYEQQFLMQVELAHGGLGKITARDVNTTTKAKVKKVDNFKHNDENTRVFNLKWHHDPTARRDSTGTSQQEVKDYDNNLLFKSPLEQQLLTNRKNNLDRLRDTHSAKSYTVALLEEMAQEIYPDAQTPSQGADLFAKRLTQTLDVGSFRLLNHNKFDFMRKVIGFMAARKKMQKVIGLKPVPELYPRRFSDVRQEAYNPDLPAEKVRYAMGRTDRRPRLYL